MKNISIYFILFLVSIFNLNGQIKEPVKWSFSEKNLGNNEFEITFKSSIEDGWAVYSQHTSPDGPVPTEITYENESVIELVGSSIEEGHKKAGYDNLFKTEVIKFVSDKDFVIRQKVKLKGNGPLTGYLTYMSCNDKTCLPPTDVEFSFPLTSTSNAVSSNHVQKATSPVTTASNSAVETTSKKINSTPVVKPVIKPIEQPKITHSTPVVKPLSEPIQEHKTVKVHSTTKPTVIKTAKNVETANKAIKNVKANVPKIAPVSLNLGKDTNTNSTQDDNDILEPVQWSFTKEQINDTEYQVKYTATVNEGWSIYSQHTSEDGPVPTEIVYETKDNIEIIGDNVETGYKKEGPDPYFDGVNVIKFLSKQPFEISQKVKLKKTDSTLKGYITYMACNDKTCLPPTDKEFEFKFGNGGSITSTPLSATEVGGKLDQRRPDLINSLEKPAGNCSSNKLDDNKSLAWLFIAGLLGGFAALLTPCVFPMIPITVSFFTKDTKRKGWVNGLIYAASIIAIYVALGLIITLAFGPEALNALSTNWIANVIFFVIFIVFAFSFFGFYEITLPSSWTTKTDQMADKGGLIGIFFMATTLALVSFSCTGPIVGSALVAAANGGLVGPLAVMVGFSIALSLPFGLFAAFPSWLNSLPRSGGWMNSVKVVLGFLEVGFAFKFLSTADLTQHWGFLRYELFMGILIVVMIAIVIYLLGFIKFPHDSPLKKLSIPRIGFAIFFGAVALYLASGFQLNSNTGIYKSLSAISGFPPPVNYNYLLSKPEVDPAIKAKYPSFDKCANNIDCFKDYYEGLAYAKEQNKPVFLDFTGHGCQNCRRTEDNIWVQDKVRNILNDDVVLVSLYVDDRKKLDTPFISLNDNKKKRNVGNKWADFQVVNFKQNSQPLYIMMTADEKVITAPRGYENGVKSYTDYLNCGLDWYNSNK